MSRTPIISGNWKMFKTREEARTTCRSILEKTRDVEGVEMIVFPPFTALDAVQQVTRGSSLQVGAQNVHWEEQGAFTGEISPRMLLDCGCEYVLLGHSERRQYFGETDESVSRKVKAVLATSLTPVICVGESLSQREAGQARDVVLGQLERGLSELTAQDLFRIIIAYEPLWAIGTGRTATPETAQEVHYMIRNWLGERFSAELPGSIRILYGGSVNPSNVSDLMAQDDIDGALVGGASLNPESFVKLVCYRESA